MSIRKWLLAGTAVCMTASASAQTWIPAEVGGRKYNLMLVEGSNGGPPIVILQDAAGKAWVLGQGSSSPAVIEQAPAVQPSQRPARHSRVQERPVQPQVAEQAPANVVSKEAAKVVNLPLAAAAEDVTLAAAPSTGAVCDSLPAVDTLLPCGPLSTKGGQIIGQDGAPVRLHCTAWWGSLPDKAAQMGTIVTSGFNCLRVSWFNSRMASDLAMIDEAVKLAAQFSIRVIVNNHANEGSAGGCNAQQANGLWYDRGGASDGTDGCGTPGTVDDAKWVSDWVKVAQHYAGNDTVIGYDLWNEPTNYGKGSNWGSGDPLHDIRLAYERAGRAIQAVDSDKLIIAEGSQDYSTGAPQGDLRGVRAYPVRLTVPNKVVYSVHEYPASVAGSNKLSDGQAYCTQMKSVWGYLVMEDVAPVWIGENGASMNNAGDQAWADTIILCLDGMVTADQQPPGGDWWMWDHCDGCGNPNGALQADRKTVKPEQAAVFTRMVQRKRGKAVGSAVAYGNQVSRALGVSVQLAAGDASNPDTLPAPNSDSTTAPLATATTPALAALQKQTAASIAEADALIARVTAGRGK